MNTPRHAAVTPPKKRSLVAERSISAPVSEPRPLTVPFFPGDVIADKYEVVGMLGAGGVAYVISALHLELGEMVALKFLRPESLAHEEVVSRFASEARSVARIKSEHVAHVFDVGTLPDGAPFIVMEYLEGKDLAEVLAARGRLPTKVAIDYVLQACEALACAHVGGIVHRDIKPENLFLTQSAGSVEVVKVLDFGISKSALAAVEPGAKRRAHTMLPMGTPGYMSPEQIRACGTVDARTDIWAIGCVLSELLTGKSAFDAPTIVQLSASILENDPIPLCQLLPDAPPALEAVILKCLEKDPNKRFQDVAELAVALYPFGPRRARVSAERCHHVLNGQQGMVIEFSSVAPPPLGGGNTPLPVSSTGAVVSTSPISSAAPEPFTTSKPATITTAASTPPQMGRRFVTVGALALVAAAMGVLGFTTFGERYSPTTGAAAVAARAAELPRVAPVPAPEPAPVALETMPSSAPANEDDGAPSDVAEKRVAKRGKPTSAKRAPKTQPVTQATATAAVKAPSAKHRTSVGDSEPDVGY
jgi:eukaryotic-like serine/threonine-protein kinase